MTNVLLIGESGVGKSFILKWMHYLPQKGTCTLDVHGCGKFQNLVTCRTCLCDDPKPQANWLDQRSAFMNLLHGDPATIKVHSGTVNINQPIHFAICCNGVGRNTDPAFLRRFEDNIYYICPTPFNKAPYNPHLVIAYLSICQTVYAKTEEIPCICCVLDREPGNWHTYSRKDVDDCCENRPSAAAESECGRFGDPFCRDWYSRGEISRVDNDPFRRDSSPGGDQGGMGDAVGIEESSTLGVLRDADGQPIDVGAILRRYRIQRSGSTVDGESRRSSPDGASCGSGRIVGTLSKAQEKVSLQHAKNRRHTASKQSATRWVGAAQHASGGDRVSRLSSSTCSEIRDWIVSGQLSPPKFGTPCSEGEGARSETGDVGRSDLKVVYERIRTPTGLSAFQHAMRSGHGGSALSVGIAGQLPVFVPGVSHKEKSRERFKKNLSRLIASGQGSPGGSRRGNKHRSAHGRDDRDGGNDVLDSTTVDAIRAKVARDVSLRLRHEEAVRQVRTVVPEGGAGELGERTAHPQRSRGERVQALHVRKLSFGDGPGVRNSQFPLQSGRNHDDATDAMSFLAASTRDVTCHQGRGASPARVFVPEDDDAIIVDDAI